MDLLCGTLYQSFLGRERERKIRTLKQTQRNKITLETKRPQSVKSHGLLIS